MSEDTFKKTLGYTTLMVALAAIIIAVFNTLARADDFDRWLQVTQALLSWETALAALVGFTAPTTSRALEKWIATK